MTNLNRPARLNRGLLAVVGLLLLAAGGFAVATYFGALTLVKPDSPLVPAVGDPPTLALYATTVAAVVIGLLTLRWVLAQLARKSKTHTWHFEQDPDRGQTELAASTAIVPFLDEVSAYPGVHAAHATLAGTRAAAALALVVSVEQHGDLGAIRHELDTVGLPRLRQALDLDTLPVTVEFRFSTKAGSRAR
jgi:hypothetical protein